MTLEEIKAYMGLAPIPVGEDAKIPAETKVNENKKDNVFAFFDAFVDAEEKSSEDDGPVPPQQPQQAQQGLLPEVDHKRFMSVPRQQGTCGSCWAFSTALAVEANYNIRYNYNSGNMYPYVSTQEMVDCVNNGAYGCKGGWMHDALKSLSVKGVIAESYYPYEGALNSCRTAGKPYTNLISAAAYDGCSWSTWFGKYPCTKESWHKHLTQGPLTVVLNAEDNFSRYRSGIIDSSQIADCGAFNHAVVAYAWRHYNYNNYIYEYIEIRNSWGLTYGDKGDVRYFYNSGNGTCYVTNLGFRPLLN